MIDNNNNNIDNNNTIYDKKGRVVVIIPTTLIKDTFNRCLFNEIYANIIYLILNKGYSYSKEVKNICACDSRHYFSYLVKNGIIEEFDLSQEQKKALKIAKKLNNHNFTYLQAYRLTPVAIPMIQSQTLYNLMIEKVSNNVKRYIVDLQDTYIKNIENDKRNWDLKLKIAREKSPRYRTAEDEAILSMELLR